MNDAVQALGCDCEIMLNNVSGGGVDVGLSIRAVRATCDPHRNGSQSDLARRKSDPITVHTLGSLPHELANNFAKHEVLSEAVGTVLADMADGLDGDILIPCAARRGRTACRPSAAEGPGFEFVDGTHRLLMGHIERQWDEATLRPVAKRKDLM